MFGLNSRRILTDSTLGDLGIVLVMLTLTYVALIALSIVFTNPLDNYEKYC